MLKTLESTRGIWKILLGLFLFLIVTIICLSYARAYTYDGVIDPKVFDEWTRVGYEPEDKEETQRLSLLRNPEAKKEPEYVLIRIYICPFCGEWHLAMYAYYKKDLLHIFLRQETLSDTEIHYLLVTKFTENVKDLEVWKMNFEENETGIISSFDEVKEYLDTFLIEYVKKITANPSM